MDPDRLVKAYNAGKSISHEEQLKEKRETRAGFPRECDGRQSAWVQFQAQTSWSYLNERERGGRLHPLLSSYRQMAEPEYTRMSPL